MNALFKTNKLAINYCAKNNMKTPFANIDHTKERHDRLPEQRI